MTFNITLTPAYGRDYTSKAKALAAWNDGADFIINTISHPYDGKPINKPQFTDANLSGMIRYDKQRKVVML